MGIVYLSDQALGTSAATFQHFEYNKKRLGHLLDPRTGRPAEGLASASAVAPTAAEATTQVVIGLSAVILALRDGDGFVLTVRPHDERTGGPSLRGGAFIRTKLSPPSTRRS